MGSFMIFKENIFFRKMKWKIVNVYQVCLLLKYSCTIKIKTMKKGIFKSVLIFF